MLLVIELGLLEVDDVYDELYIEGVKLAVDVVRVEVELELALLGL